MKCVAELHIPKPRYNHTLEYGRVLYDFPEICVKMIERHDQGKADPQTVFDHSCLYLLRLTTWTFLWTALSFIRMNVLFVSSQLLFLFPEESPLHRIRHAED